MRPLPAAVLAILLLAGCEGPTGPAGPAGPPGEPGPGTRIVLSSIVDGSGVATVSLPSEAGTLQSPPGLTCLLGETVNSAHLVIGYDDVGPFCGLGLVGGTLEAAIVDAPPGWSARFVVVY